MSEERPPLPKTPLRDRLHVPDKGEVYDWPSIRALAGVKTIDSLSQDELRSLIREEVQRALHPEPGLYDVRHFLAVEATDEQGNKWKGLLYAVETQS